VTGRGGEGEGGRGTGGEGESRYTSGFVIGILKRSLR
jgi:hypothetical protein